MRYEPLFSPFYKRRNQGPKRLQGVPEITCNRVSQQGFELRGLASVHIPSPLQPLNWQPPLLTPKVPEEKSLAGQLCLLQSNISHYKGGNSSVPLSLCFLISLCFCDQTGLGVTDLMQIGYLNTVTDKRLAASETAELTAGRFRPGPGRDAWFCLHGSVKVYSRKEGKGHLVSSSRLIKNDYVRTDLILIMFKSIRNLKCLGTQEGEEAV